MSFIQPIPCPTPAGAGVDVEDLILCDVDALGNVVGTAIAVYEYDGTTGMPIGAPTFVIPGTTTPYVPVGTLQPCEQPEANSEVLCDVQPDGSSVQFVRTYHFSSSGTVTGFHDATLAGAIYTPTGIVQECDPYSTCTPDSNLDLNADCGPGQSPLKPIITADSTHPLANSVFTDDPAADPLCGGTWDNPAAPLVAPFPVNESFRNTTFDQAGPVTQGTAPYPQLTAGAPINDGAGSGWMRMSDINSGTNAIWQVPSPFSSAQGMTSAITFASHDGTTPGGDGLAFVFTDGSVAAQGIPIGGFGNLGLNNWQGGYVAVVLDEYGQTCTCDHTASPTVSPNPGPCGFCPNTISIQLAGAARATASCACCTIAQAPTAPKAVNLTTRGQPGRLYVSIIAEGGSTFVSAGIDWNDGNGVVQYFDRVDVTACAGAPPATLRMAAYGGSGGAYRAVKEYRDASARPAGASHWRSFPITTDPIPACVSLVNLTASVDVTFNSDTQVAGNSNPEAYFWLVNEATNTVVARAEKSSIPTQVGVKNTLTFTTAVPPTDIPNLKLYVGSEARDESGEYDTLWENLKVDATGAGCPAVQHRTLEISARCPIPVAIVSGGSTGGGGGTTVVNTPSTFEDAVICYVIGGVHHNGFRRETHAPDGTNTVSFLGQDGLPVNPDTWFPGSCDGTSFDQRYLCDDNGQFVRTFVYDAAGALIISFDTTYQGGLPYVTVGLVSNCDLINRENQILCDDTGPFIRQIDSFQKGGTGTSFLNFELDHVTIHPIVGPIKLCVTDIETQLVCDGNSSTTLIASYHYDSNGALIATLYYQLDGVGPVAAVGPFYEGGCCVPIDIGPVCYDVLGDIRTAVGQRRCRTDDPVLFDTFWYDSETGVFLGGTADITIVDCPANSFDFEEEILCDNNGPFIRRYTYVDGVVSTTTNFDLAGAAYVPVGTVAVCPTGCENTIELIGRCDYTGTPGALGFTTFFERLTWDCNGALVSADTITATGTPYVPTGTVKTGLCDPEITQEILCDSNGTQFLRRYSWTDRQIGVNNVPLVRSDDFALDGFTPFVPVGAVGLCPVSTTVVTERDVEIVTLCDDNGGFLRRFVFDEATGLPTTVVTTDFAGNPYVTVGTVKVCDQTVTVTELDSELEVLCDNATTTFLRRYLFNETTGAISGTADFTLAGTAYVAAGPVTAGVCNSCCPIALGEGCATGGRKWTSLRAANGTVTLIDQSDGSTVLPADVVTCPADDPVETLNSQGRLLAAAGVWTPGADVVGVLTSVTFTVLSGTATLVDSNGTSSAGLPTGYTATWDVEDANTLVGPTSITAVGGSTMVLWTQR